MLAPTSTKRRRARAQAMQGQLPFMDEPVCWLYFTMKLSLGPYADMPI